MGQTLAQQLSPEQAKAKAEAFLSAKTGFRSASDLQLRFAVSDTTQLDADAAGSLRAATKGNALLYAFDNQLGGYVITSGEERAHAVLGYSTTGTLDAGDLPDGMRELLRQYAVEIATLRDGGAVEESPAELSYDPAWQPVGPLITSLWGQEDPFNRQTPDVNGMHTVTGCPATMFAQLMDYYQYQNWKVEEETWFSGKDDPQKIDREVTVRFDSPVDWSLLRRVYRDEPFTEAEANEVAKLMKYTGAAMHIDYGLDISTIEPSEVLSNMARVADYGGQATVAQAWQYPLRSWSEKLYRQLAAGRPMPYASLGGGHIFLMDGYAGEGMFHFNWGWDGETDGNFLLSALLTEDSMHLYQVGFFDCCPATMEPINVEPVLLRTLTIDTTGETPTFNIVLYAEHAGLQIGQFQFALVSGEGVDPLLSDTISFSFTPDGKHESDTIRVPFPQYAEMNQPVYAFVPMQRMGEEWVQMHTQALEGQFQALLTRVEDQYELSFERVELTVTLAEAPQVVLLNVETPLKVDVTNLTGTMVTAEFKAKLFNDSLQKEFAVGTRLIAEQRQQLDLSILVKHVPEGSYQLQVSWAGGIVGTVPVKVERSTSLVITQMPDIPDTLKIFENYPLVYRVKNVGARDFNGALSFAFIIPAEEGTRIGASRKLPFKLAAGEEVPVEIPFAWFSQPTSGYFILAQDTDIKLCCEGEKEPYAQTVVITLEGATANEEILAESLQIAWQGTTLCVQAPAPLQAYHIYNVKGSLVATGSASGHELRIDGSAWTAGVYVVAIETADGKTIVGKIRL